MIELPFMSNQKILYAHHQIIQKTLELINSLRKYCADKLLICRTDSGYVYESDEGLSIHFH